MSKSSNIRRNIGLLFMFGMCVAFVCADLVVSSASSGAPKQDETTRGGVMTSNSNSGNANVVTTHRRRRRRRSTTAAVATVQGDAGTASMTSSDMSGTQTDLSGTYTGTVNYPEGGLNGAATLTITGTQFSIAPEGGGTPVTGTVTAVTTRGYTGVTMMFGDRTAIPVTQSPPPLPAVSLRARMVGGRVTLMSVQGEKREFSFSSAGAGKARTHRTRTTRKARKTASTGGDQNRGVDASIKPPTP